MTSADRDLVTDLDHLDPEDEEGNAVWAKKLFSPARRTADQSSSTANDSGTREQQGDDRPEPSEPTQSMSPGCEAIAVESSPPRPVNLAAMAASLDAVPAASSTKPDDGRPSSPGAVWASVLGVLAVIGAAVMTTILLASGRSDPPVKTEEVPTLTEGAPAADLQTSAAPAPADDVIPYHAQWRGCYEGSTDEQTLQQALQDPTGPSTAVCVRGFGGTGGGTNGQQILLAFGNEMTGNQFYYVSRFEITSGWVTKTPGGKDEWGKHLVPKRIRYVLNPDSSRPTVGECDTGAVRGPVPCILDKPVLASSMSVIVIEAVRPPNDVPPADPTSTSTPGLPPFGTTPTPDPEEVTATDGTFAISLLQVKGQVAMP